MRIASDILILLVSFATVWAVDTYELSSLTMPILGVLIGLYMLTSFGQSLFFHNTKAFPYPREAFHAFLLTSVILLLISSTGNLESPFFFLLYFLPFVLSFLLSPSSALVFSLLSCAFFLQALIAADYVRGMVQIGSFIGIAPLAFYFGSEYRDHQRLKAASEKTASGITKDIGMIISDESGKLSQTESRALTDILHRIEELRRADSRPGKGAYESEEK